MTKHGVDKKIALFISSLSNGGAERVTCNLANFLSLNGYIVDVITLSNKNDTYKLKKNIKRINLLDKHEQKGKIHNLLVAQNRLKKYIINNKDVACFVVMLPVNSFMLTRMRRKIKGRVIVSERVNPASYDRIASFMMRYAANNSDGLVVQTNEIRKWYKYIRNVAIIPNAINMDINLSRNKKIEKKFVAVGRLSKQKNYPMLIEAFKTFNKKHPDYRLEIFGEGSEEKALREIITKDNLKDKVILRGYVSNISEQISNATGFVMASNYEGMANALIEAMCIGIPCVATDCDGGGAKAIIKNLENGVLVEKNDAVGMCEGMLKIVEDEKFNSKISKNAVMLRDELNPGIIYKKWQEFIDDVIVQKNR